MSRLINLVWLCALVCSTVEGARILGVFPFPSISHQVAFRPLTHELARRGHEVVVVTTDPAFPKGQAPKNLTEIDVRDISYEIWRKLLTTYDNGNKDEFYNQFEALYSILLEIFEKQTEFPEVRDIIEKKNHTFDLLLVEGWTRYALGFSHAVKVPVIGINSFGAFYENYDVMGGPTHPVIYPGALSTRVYNLSLWEKFNQYYNYLRAINRYQKIEEKENAMLRKIFGVNTPPLSELKNNVHMLFLNVHPLWEGNYPVPPSVIHIGGIHQNPEKELPQDLKQYLDSSVHGVIYLSFGTNVDTSVLPPHKIQAIISVFSKLPYDVLWKWNQDELPGKTKNIRISKWFPQSDLLRHPKVKLFISQGGLQSTDESITAGVPLIGVPMLGDQWYNAEKYEHLGIGKKINLEDLGEETLMNAVKTIIEDESYRNNVARLRSLIYDKPQSSLERAVWWTEHVLRHGGARHLRAPAANMDWAEYYDIQLALVLIGIAVSVLVLSSFVLYKVVSFLLSGPTSTKIKKS